MLRNSLIIISLVLLISSCTKKDEMPNLMEAINAYETAWASGDFLTVEAFFTEDAKRLHTEPEVWDRKEIKRYFEERALQNKDTVINYVPDAWKEGREYIEIRIEGNIAYDIFTTDKFKAMHIWEKQKDGRWLIKYDVGMLN